MFFTCYLSLALGRKHKNTQKNHALAPKKVEEPRKILLSDKFYMDFVQSICACDEHPTSTVWGKTLEEHDFM